MAQPEVNQCRVTIWPGHDSGPLAVATRVRARQSFGAVVDLRDCLVTAADVHLIFFLFLDLYA